jgi:hypothetical protein
MMIELVGTIPLPLIPNITSSRSHLTSFLPAPASRSSTICSTFLGSPLTQSTQTPRLQSYKAHFASSRSPPNRLGYSQAFPAPLGTLARPNPQAPNAASFAQQSFTARLGRLRCQGAQGLSARQPKKRNAQRWRFRGSASCQEWGWKAPASRAVHKDQNSGWNKTILKFLPLRGCKRGAAGPCACQRR